VSERELRLALEAAKGRLARATKALAPKHKGGEMAEFCAAHEAMLAAERVLAAELGEPYAVPLEFPVQWDIGAPLPHLIKTDSQTFLLFLLGDTQLQRDGFYAAVANPSGEHLATVEFKGCVSAKMGNPNDEVFQGHPLHGKGLVGYRPLRVLNSTWIRELEAINSVHRQFKADRWNTLSHYIFGFHDCTFECVAQSFVVQTAAVTIPAALAAICQRLVA
jgi:hypothetical protein